MAADLGWRWTLWIISIIVSGLPFSRTMTELFTNHAPGRYSNPSKFHLHERDLCTYPPCSNSQKDASRIGRSIVTAKGSDQRQAYDTLSTCHYPTYQDTILLSDRFVSLSFQCFGLRDDVPAVYNLSDSLPTPIWVRHSYFRPQLPWTRSWDADGSLLFQDFQRQDPKTNEGCGYPETRIPASSHDLALPPYPSGVLFLWLDG